VSGLDARADPVRPIAAFGRAVQDLLHSLKDEQEPALAVPGSLAR
jgi:hypothetical protein